MITGSLTERLRQYANLAGLSYTERFEQTAHRFFVATGLVVPGKLRSVDDPADGPRMAAWTKFQREEGEQYRADLRGAAEALEKLS